MAVFTTSFVCTDLITLFLFNSIWRRQKTSATALQWGDGGHNDLRQGLDPDGRSGLGLRSCGQWATLSSILVSVPNSIAPTGCTDKDISKFYSCLLHFDCSKIFSENFRNLPISQIFSTFFQILH